jgi:hypothetical protein
VVGASGTAVVGATTTGGGAPVAVGVDGVVAAGTLAGRRRPVTVRCPVVAGWVGAGASPDTTDSGSAASPIRCAESWLAAQATAAAAAIPSRAAATDMIARRLMVRST